MAVVLPTKIECALLYDEFGQLNAETILQHLNFSLEPFDLRFQLARAEQGFMLFSGHNLFVLISQNQQPLPAEGFTQTLVSPFTQMTFPNADQVVQRHRKNIFITVSTELPMPAELDKFKETLGVGSNGATREQFDNCMFICQTTVNLLFRKKKPEAVHWCQSNQLMSPSAYDQLSLMPFPTPLYVHPSLFSSREEIEGVQVIGMTTWGAGHLIGMEVIFNEAPVPFNWMYSKICAFVDTCREGHMILPDGDTFGTNADEVIRIKHLPKSERFPGGAVELTLEKSVEHGFDQSEILKETTQALLNPDDPLERAMIEKLHQMRSTMGETTPVESGQASEEPRVAAGGFGMRKSGLRH